MTRSIVITLLATALPFTAQASTASQRDVAVEPLQIASQTTTEQGKRSSDAVGYRDVSMSVAMENSQHAVNVNGRDAAQADDERSWLEILSDNSRDLGAPAGW